MNETIQSRQDYRRFLMLDAQAQKASFSHPIIQTDNSMVWLTDLILRWKKTLRLVEYVENCYKSIVFAPVKFFLRWRFQKRSAQLGFSIPINVCGPGLAIVHYGSIVVSRHSRIGSFCTINSGVNIGVNPYKEDGAPIIGDNVYIGPGAKIWGGISIADNTKIGANSCVFEPVCENGKTVIGVNRII